MIKHGAGGPRQCGFFKMDPKYCSCGHPGRFIKEAVYKPDDMRDRRAYHPTKGKTSAEYHCDHCDAPFSAHDVFMGNQYCLDLNEDGTPFVSIGAYWWEAFLK